jgi:hypothetical protein
MERCPICRASLSEPPLCRRCKSDLSLPLAISAEAEICLQHASRALLAGDPSRAAEAAARSHLLYQSDLAQALVGFSHWLHHAPRA